MYRVSGSLTMARGHDVLVADIGLRRQALGLRSPLRYALAATLASDAVVMPWSCM